MLKPSLCDYSDAYILAEEDFISPIDRGVEYDNFRSKLGPT